MTSRASDILCLRRQLTSSTLLNDYEDFPGVKQVFRVQQRVIEKKIGDCYRPYSLVKIAHVSAKLNGAAARRDAERSQ